MAAGREVRSRGGEAVRNGMWCGPSLIHRALAMPAGLLHISVADFKGRRSSKRAIAPRSCRNSLLFWYGRLVIDYQLDRREYWIISVHGSNICSSCFQDVGKYSQNYHIMQML